MTDFLIIPAGDTRWTIRPEWRQLLLGPHGLRLNDWLQSGQARIVKQGPHRIVYRVSLPELDFYIKHNRLWNLRAWLRELIRPAKARIEFLRACQVAERGIDTIEPLALGEAAGLRPADSFLITRSLDDTEQLNTFLEQALPAFPPARQVRIRQALALALGGFLRRLHDQGITHHDLHPGNLLLRRGPEDMPRLYLIDLHAVRVGRPLTDPQRRANLVLLNHWFGFMASRSDRFRFWRSYRGPQGDRQEAGLLERLTLRSQLDFCRSRDQRCLAGNRYFHRVRRGDLHGHALRDLPAELLDRLLADPDQPFERADAVVLKDSRSSTVVALEYAGQQLIYKRFPAQSWQDSWLGLVRPPAALRSWRMGHALLHRCLPTPRPLAVWQHRRTADCYLLTEKIDDAQGLDVRFNHLASLPDADRQRQLWALIDRLAKLLRELHQRRMSHRDLKASNILVHGAGGVWLIDLVGVRCHGQLARPRRVQNLARLNASFHQDARLSRSDRLRFLRVYLQWGLTGRAGWKRWWRQIEAATQAKAERNQRLGRILG